MGPEHRAQLATAIDRFLAEIRRLAAAVPAEEREQVLYRLDPTRPRPAPPSRTRKQPAAKAAGASAPEPARRTRRRKPASGPATSPAAGAVPQAPPTAPPPEPGSTAGPTEVGAADGGSTTAPTAAPAVASLSPVGSNWGQGGKRIRWTRDTIVSELASWILSGTAIDAAFLKRHGPPGLVAAALRIFGRFDAAMNVAGLHIAKLYPDGPPKPGR